MLSILKAPWTNAGRPSLNEIEDLFDSIADLQNIEYVNWENYPYKPDVKFKIAHSGDEIYLQYIVKEKYIRAKFLNNNESVWNDSCVEFFISPIKDGSYYNFEFNCIGTALIGFGYEKEKRERAGIDIVNSIRSVSSLGRQAIEHKEGDFTWKITLAIPISTLYKHQLKSITGICAKANFYKCGDELKEPHFLSWQAISFPKPNFHLPEFFGEVTFEP